MFACPAYRGIMMDRRKLLTGLVSAAVLRVGALHAAQRPVIAVLEGTSPEAARYYLNHFEQALRERDHVPGRTVEVIARYAGGDASRYSQLAGELIQLGPAVIVTGSTTGALACKRLTSSIPIVSSNLTDPVEMGLVSSLSRPGGNVTGVTVSSEGQPGKLLQFLLELKPSVTKIGVLSNPAEMASSRQVRAAESAAHEIGLMLIYATVRSPEDLREAFRVLAQGGAEAIYAPSSLLLRNERKSFAELALAGRLPSVCNAREIVEVGALMSYGVDLRENYRRAAYFVDRILRGSSVTELPIENPRRFFTSVNARTARALSIKIPATLHAIADEIIE
jgi:putative tryptophan/tyrosine transport system substrate-binding protein